MIEPRRGLALLAVLLIGLVAAAQGPAQPPTGDDKAFEKSLDAGLRDVINRGADIFNNQGDYAGCFRLYEGTLLAIKPLLGNYPELQKLIEKGLGEMATIPVMSDRAHAARKVLDEIRFTVNPKVRPAVALWDRLGGEKGVRKVVAEFGAAVATDPAIDITRGGKFKLDEQQARALEKSMVDMISAVSGGPYKYTGKSMKDVHKGMGITGAQFDATVATLKKVLENNKVRPDDIRQLLDAVGTTRGDIVEKGEKKEDKKDDKKPDEKKDDKKDKEKKVDDKRFPPADPTKAQLNGKVMLKGEPLTHGYVTLVDASGREFSANILPDGAYHFRVGVPAGRYTVILQNSTTPPTPDEVRTPIPMQYLTPATSGIRVELRRGGNTFDIQLK